MTFAAVIKNIKNMYSSSDCERLFIRYKAEAMPRKSMIQDIKSYRYRFERKENTEPCPVRMMIDIRMTNGIRIQQRNLTYRNLKSLIEKLEGQC